MAARHPDLAFSLPASVDYICDKQESHAGSMQVYNASSGALHVDDSFNVRPLLKVVRQVLSVPQIGFRASLPDALDDSPNA